jgi:hypothetical protein
MNACVRIVVLTLASCYSLSALAQEQASGADDLDVTMQIIVDPNAKLPDEVVRRIPLPAQRSSASSASPTRSGSKPDTKPDAATRGSERSQESREGGKEAADSARERAKEAREQAREQREEARDAANDAKDKDKGKDKDPPGRPDRPNPPRP